MKSSALQRPSSPGASSRTRHHVSVATIRSLVSGLGFRVFPQYVSDPFPLFSEKAEKAQEAERAGEEEAAAEEEMDALGVESCEPEAGLELAEGAGGR